MKTETEPITGAFLNDLKVGDKVWVGDPTYGKKSNSARILPVLSRTKTLIRVPSLAGQAKNFRITQSEFTKSWSAYESPARMSSDSILDIATPEECAAYAAKKEHEAKERKDYDAAQTARAGLRAQLRELFSPDAETNTVYVHDAEWTKEREQGKFDVKFHGLTEQQVRELAEKIR